MPRKQTHEAWPGPHLLRCQVATCLQHSPPTAPILCCSHNEFPQFPQFPQFPSFPSKLLHASSFILTSFTKTGIPFLIFPLPSPKPAHPLSIFGAPTPSPGHSQASLAPQTFAMLPFSFPCAQQTQDSFL